MQFFFIQEGRFHRRSFQSLAFLPLWLTLFPSCFTPPLFPTPLFPSCFTPLPRLERYRPNAFFIPLISSFSHNLPTFNLPSPLSILLEVRPTAFMFASSSPALPAEGISDWVRGNQSSFRCRSCYHPVPVLFSQAKESSIWDPEGKRYIDFLSAYSAVNQGHSHPTIIKALIEQSEKLTLSSRAFYNDKFPVFAERLTSMFGYNMVKPMNTGAEGVETALKLARKWGYLKKVIPRDRL